MFIPSLLKKGTKKDDPYFPAVQAFHRIFVPWYDSPIDMTDAMLGYIRVLHECAANVSGGSSPGGLDDLFPLIVWTISRCTKCDDDINDGDDGNSGNKEMDISLKLFKGLGYLELFIEDTSGESAFYLCAIMSAVQYLVKCFGVTKDEEMRKEGEEDHGEKEDEEKRRRRRRRSSASSAATIMMLKFNSQCNNKAIHDLRCFLTHVDMEETVMDSMM
jgi:hypothetical protein